VERAKHIARAMLRFVECPDLESVADKPDFRDWGLVQPDVGRLLEHDANAFLFGNMLTRAEKAEKAWEGPFLLKQRLGHLAPQKIARMTPSGLARFVGRYRGQPALHRFVADTAKYLVLACRRLVSQYSGDASNIWANDPGAVEVLRRLREFDGIQQKIANMATRLLIQYYGVRISNWHEVDIAVDRHVGRVFLRTGLVSGSRKTRISEIRSAVIEEARRLHPKYPAALDEPAFWIGKEWCTADKADCWHEEGDCPLADVCTKRKRSWQVW